MSLLQQFISNDSQIGFQLSEKSWPRTYAMHTDVLQKSLLTETEFNSVRRLTTMAFNQQMRVLEPWLCMWPDECS